MLIFPIDHLPRMIPVGVQTSMGVEEIGFYIRPWLEKWPGMTFEVWPTRPTETAAYPAVCQLIGDVLVWYVSDADTAFEGLGTVEVVGIAEGIRKPSGPCTTEIKKTSLGVTQEPPEGIKPYYEGMMEAAKVIKENVDVGTSGLYIVRATPDPDFRNFPKADRTQEEIRAAVAAGKTVLLVYSELESDYTDAHEARVMTYAGEIVKDASGNTCPTFDGYIVNNTKGIPYYYQAYVQTDGYVSRSGSVLRAATRFPLKFSGAVEATYDGRETITVNIPQSGSGGIPDPGTAHQQLVSDENCKAVWVDRLAYKYTGQVEVLPETALTYMGEDEGFQMHALSTSLMGVLDEGKTYQVNYNDTAYDCPIVSADEGKALVLGKTSVLGFEGGNNDAPFALIVYNDAETIEGMGGIGGMCASLDGATSVTISITGECTVYKKLPGEYLPDNRVVTAHAALTKMNTTDIEFGEWDMTFDELWEAFNAGHDVRVLCAATGNASGDNPTNDQVVGRIDYAQEIPSTGGKLMRMRMPWSLFNDTERLIAISKDESGAMVFTQITAD